MKSEKKKSRPKICFVLPSMIGGGIESFLLRLGKYLHEHGCDVDIVTTTSPGFQFHEIAENGLHGHSFSFTQYTIPILHARAIARLLRSKQYDVIFHNICPFTQIIAGQLPDECTVISVIHGIKDSVMHGNADNFDSQQLTNEDATNLYVGISPAIMERAKAILKKRPVVYIPHGLDVSPGHRRDDASLPSNSHVILLFSGRLCDDQKGVLFLPEILDRVRKSGISAVLRIAGEGPCREQLLARMDAYHLREYVEMLGHLSRSQLYAQYEEAHILLFPTRFEGFGLSLIEAMVHGCVPVASRIPGVTDSVIRDTEDGLLAPIGDTQAFAVAVEMLCGNPSQWKSMSDAGKARISREFSLQKMGDTYMQVISDAMNGQYALPSPRHTVSSYDRNLLRPRHFIPGWLLRLLVRCSVLRILRCLGINRLWGTSRSDGHTSQT